MKNAIKNILVTAAVIVLWSIFSTCDTLQIEKDEIIISGIPKIGETLTATSSGNFIGKFQWTHANSADSSSWSGTTFMYLTSGDNDRMFTINNVGLIDFEGKYIKVWRYNNDYEVIYSNVIGPIQSAP